MSRTWGAVAVLAVIVAACSSGSAPRSSSGEPACAACPDASVALHDASTQEGDAITEGGFDGGAEASVSAGCAAAGGQCIASGGICWGVPTSAAADQPALCGSPDAFCCIVVFDAGSCTDASATVQASSYDQSCTVDTDCVGVSEGDSCNPCDFSCVNAAINAGALTQYTSDTASFPAVLAVAKGACASSCGGPETACCVGGTCHWGYFTCPDASADAGDAARPCIPLTCADLPAGDCGVQTDGCGGLIANCSTCTPPDFCGGGGAGLCGAGAPAVDAGEPVCHYDLCVPGTCADYDCGVAGDGCGGLLECGPCPSSEACIDNECIWPADAGPCVPATCQGLGYNCGVPSDGCGGHLECGTCPVSQFCGGGGVHRCGGTCDTPDGGPCEVTCSSDDGGGCTGQSCLGGGYTCGEAPNGCGGLLDCGPCGADAGSSDAPTGG
ncbi:MAG: hypothetical protein ACLP1X_33025 [Polyangiaceae bacterium]